MKLGFDPTLLARMQSRFKKILSIEDEPANSNVIGLVLHRLIPGVTCLFASGGQEGIDMILAERPDLILLDITMPDMNGYEVFNRLKHYPESREIPIVFVTARAQSRDVANGYDLGAADYLTKPFGPEGLQDSLLKVFWNLELGIYDDSGGLGWIRGQPSQTHDEFATDDFKTLLGMVQKRNESVEVRRQCVGLLGHQGDRRALEILWCVFEDDWDWLLRGAIITTAARLGAAPALIEHHLREMSYYGREKTACIDLLIAGKKPEMVSQLGYQLELQGKVKGLGTISGNRSIELAKLGRPRVILVDAMLSDMDGLDLCKRLKQLDEIKNSRVVLLTEPGSHRTAEKTGREMGVKDFVPKPIDATKLVEQVKEWLLDECPTRDLR